MDAVKRVWGFMQCIVVDSQHSLLPNAVKNIYIYWKKTLPEDKQMFFCCMNEARHSMQATICCVEANNPSHMDECMYARTLFPSYQDTSCLKKQLFWFTLTAAGMEWGTFQKDKRCGFPFAAAKHRSNSDVLNINQFICRCSRTFSLALFHSVDGSLGDWTNIQRISFFFQMGPGKAVSPPAWFPVG